ncbi:ABC transporter permease [Arsenicitalea aurantiaca]|uniref:ABC transporter permease n=1 Tax=Arsenicitalea aurantiaca TaxID=1783274 RepID=A0A433X495_9HYPH|nr:ABC transporter permease [Arsenicitalea aurantiaca]RUT28889.1 ABC transporter permease [Arsenicitalea aurantiaca]
MNRKPSRLVLLSLEIGVPLLLIAAYALWAAPRNDLYFPPLDVILTRFVADWFGPRFFSDIVPSLRRMGTGYAIALVIGVSAGVLLGLSRRTRLAVLPIVDFFRALPPSTLLPLTMIVLGVDDSAKVTLIAMVCLFPILLNTIAGVSSIDPTLRETADVFGITRRNQLLHMVLPGALPAIFAGARTAMSLAIIMMVISEFVAATNGIGFAIWTARRSFDISAMWAGILVLGCLGYGLNLLFEALERRVLAWHHAARQKSE